MEELRIQGSRTVFRPGKLVCVGRNYAAHAREMKSALPSKPMLFLKPASSLVGGQDGQILLPPESQDVHHEVELVVVLGSRLRHARPEQAHEAIAGLAVGLDMTARDIQQRAKESGHPWSVAKGFDTFAPLGPIAVADIRQPRRISLNVNGQPRQEASTGDMLFPVADLLAFASSIFTLEPGDLLFTGTPEGVGPVVDGDFLEARIEGLPPLDITVRRPPSTGRSH